MRTFLIATFISWFLIVGLIAYDNAGTTRDRGNAAMSGRVEVVFWHAMGGPLGKVMEELIDRFNNGQKKYFVKSISMGSYDTLAKKILASLVAKSGPDIAQNYETLTKKFIHHKKIVCLDALIASEPEDIKKDIVPVLLANNTFDGKIWSFPFNKSVPVLYYNKEMFRKAGIDPERPPRTMEEMASYARTLTVRDEKGQVKIYGYSTNKANVWMFLCRFIQFGGRLVDETGSDTSHFHEAAGVKALAYIQDLVKEGVANEAQGFDHQNDFKAQRVAMIDNSIVSKVHMEAGSGIRFDYGVAPLPSGATDAVILSGSNINIFDNGDPEKIKGAWEFIKFFTSTDIGAEWSARTTYMPVRISSLHSPILKSAMDKDANLRAPYVQMDYCRYEPRLACWFEIRDLMADHLERATLEMGPPSKYLEQMSREIDGILRHAAD
ncbi:MAG: ABC transporter substrate-binding protein [Candidatus Riflebacteria bacterium]|nr:ABC transporter substrate-binding protein [Candidatus Riflebacteria bacterium]